MRRTAAATRATTPGAPERLVLDAAAGYDVAARSYEEWSWSRFWDHAERPLVRDWLASQPVGVIADLGCGLGRYRDLMQRRGDDYIGVDISRKMLDKNRKKHRSLPGEGRLIRADLRSLPLSDSSIDAALCTRVLSHVREPIESLREIARILKPGAQCLLTDIDPSHAYQYTHMPTPRGDVAIETYKHRWETLSRAVSAVGLRVEHRSVLTPRDLHRGATPLRLPNGRVAQDKPLLYACVLEKGYVAELRSAHHAGRP